jgi:hypothetical protein
MSNPQPPERDLAADAPGGPVPPENQPGHHPAEEQDKPALDKFAAKLGVMAPAEREEVLADEAPATASQAAAAPAPAARRNALAGVAAVAALVAVVLAVLTGRRRRSRR